jgi:3-deoxy-manno-octulosonate cytidylyltransferase (CMP-KDO synthetase)
MAFNGQAIGVIPARLASTRFPNKPLALIHNLPMICWTLRSAARARSLREVFVAAQDEAIVAAVLKQGGAAKLIQGDFRSGSDRVAEAVRGLDVPAVVNIQADEPLIEGEEIDRALALLEARPEFAVTTVVRPMRNTDEYLNPNCVKAVLDQNSRCLYFSRAPVPAQKNPAWGQQLPEGFRFFKHIGIYCFRRMALQRFSQLPESALENCEGLEQLRLLEYGAAIGAVVSSSFAPAVDAPEDLLALEEHLRRKGSEVG